jgi:hypothetical protein
VLLEKPLEQLPEQQPEQQPEGLPQEEPFSSPFPFLPSLRPLFQSVSSLYPLTCESTRCSSLLDS